MGQSYKIKCSSCDYCISVTEGIGMMYSPQSVFYDQLLFSLVKSKRIKERTASLLLSGAIPDDEYGHEIYVCPKCMRFANRFYFKLTWPDEQYEPDYHCPHCKTSLRQAELKMYWDEQYAVFYKNSCKADWKCPVCGGDRLMLDGAIILWD